MSSTSPGIKTLSERLSALETNAGTSLTTFADKLLTSIASSLKNDLNTVLQNYESGLTAIGVNISDFQLIDLVKVIPYTVTFVEKNASIIAGIIRKDVTSQFKLSTALTFIQQYFSKEEEFLVAWIEHEVDVLFNNGSTTLQNTLVNTKSKTLSTPTNTVTKTQGKKIVSFFKKSK